MLTPTLSGQNAWRDEWLKQDKVSHLVFSTWLTVGGISLAEQLHFKNPELVAVITVLAIGGVKEFILDKQPQPYDLGSNYIGVTIAIPVYRVIISTTKKQHKPAVLGNADRCHGKN